MHAPQWVEQCTDGAVILAPFGTCYANGALLKLTVDGGTSSGRFVGTAAYMWVRGERPGRRLSPPDDRRTSASVIEPGQVLGGAWAQDFVLGLWVPDIGCAHRGEGEKRQAQFWDQAGTSVTLVSYDRWYEPTSVVAYGPRNLWSEVVAAYTTWREAGQPDLSRFGVTVSEHGWRTWLDDPGNVIARRLP